MPNANLKYPHSAGSNCAKVSTCSLVITLVQISAGDRPLEVFNSFFQLLQHDGGLLPNLAVLLASRAGTRGRGAFLIQPARCSNRCAHCRLAELIARLRSPKVKVQRHLG